MAPRSRQPTAKADAAAAKTSATRDAGFAAAGLNSHRSGDVLPSKPHRLQPKILLDDIDGGIMTACCWRLIVNWIMSAKGCLRRKDSSWLD